MSHETGPQHESFSSSDIETDVPHEEESDFDLSENVSSTHLLPERVRIVSHGTNDWNPDFVAQLPVLSRPNPKSFGEVSSIVRDAGYSLELSDIAKDRPPEQSFDLTGLGTQFDPNNTTRSESFNDIENLNEWFRNKRVPSAERSNWMFLPIDQLERSMTRENIYRELYRAGVREEINAITNCLCRRGKESRQRIFAILCMLEIPAQIGNFLREGIFDRNLPFTFKNDKVYREVVTKSKRVKKIIPLFQSPPWKPIHRESFDKHQGELSAPIFKLSWAVGEKVLHFPLKDQLVLPFMRVEDTLKIGGLGTSIQRQGGTSIVRMVKIHPAHYNAPPDTVANNDLYFAVKELRFVQASDKSHGDKEDREAIALKRFNDKRDPHLIRLLATFTYEGRFHLIFPWADGNLKDLWMAQLPQFQKEDHGPELVKWMSAQVLGLACALQVIHYCEIDKANNPQDLTSEELRKPHGRHGDLKPENILWFKNESNSHSEDSIGVLKIADFGFADFHSKHSKSNVHRSAVGGITDTYRAPEYDVKQRVSPQYDIWSFGCILLQFVVWYQHGWKGVEDFSIARAADSGGAQIASDIFFGLESGGTHGFRARAKASVTDMFGSLQDDTCSDYIFDLLDYVHTDLLRVNNANRANIDDIVKKFKELHENCHLSPGYCRPRTRQFRRTNSSLSQIALPNAPDRSFFADSPPTLTTSWQPYAYGSASIDRQSVAGQATKRRSGLQRAEDGAQAWPNLRSSNSNIAEHNAGSHSPKATDSYLTTQTLGAMNTTLPRHDGRSAGSISSDENDQQPFPTAISIGVGKQSPPSIMEPSLERKNQNPESSDDVVNRHQPQLLTEPREDDTQSASSPPAQEVNSPKGIPSVGANSLVSEPNNQPQSQSIYASSLDPRPREMPIAVQTERTQDAQRLKPLAPKWKRIRMGFKRRLQKILDLCCGLDET